MKDISSNPSCKVELHSGKEQVANIRPTDMAKFAHGWYGM